MANKIPTQPPRVGPYPGGSPNSGGSGSGGTSGGPVLGPSVNIPTSNGGVFATAQVALFPCFNSHNNRNEYHAFDPTMGFNDPLAASTYSWRYEQFSGSEGSVGSFNQPTIRRLILTFRDLGRVTVTFTLTGCNDKGEVVTNSTSLGFGSATPTNRLLVTPVDIVLTCQIPQLSVRREANDGPLSIVQVVMLGEVEVATH